MQVFLCFPPCFRKVHEEVVAAVSCRLSWHVALEVGDEAEGLLHEGEDVGGGEVAAQEEVVACEASHGTPVDDAVVPLGVVAQESGGEMLDGVEGGGGEGWLTVGGFHADVEGGDGVASHVVLAAHVDASLEAEVVDGEGCDFFHVFFLNVALPCGRGW